MENKELLKKEVKEYITNLTGRDYDELENLSENIRKICSKNTYPFQAHKIIVSDGYNSFSNVYRRYYDVTSPAKPVFISEIYIKRNGIIYELLHKVEESDETYKMLKFADVLDEIIQHRLIYLETLWCMEFEKEDDLVLEENDEIIYSYFRIFALIYLQYTNKICSQYDEFSEGIIDYQNEIDKFFSKEKVLTKKKTVQE